VSQVSRLTDGGEAPTVTSETGQALVEEIMYAGDRAVWTAAALALALRDGVPGDQRRAAASVLSTLGLVLDADSPELDRHAVAAQAAAPILQSAALLTNDGPSWADQPDGAIIAQGRASARGAQAFVRLGLPMLSGLADLMAAPGARMLDVGTGVAALAISYAELFPALTVVGVDVLPRVLALAEETVRTSGVADRVVLRLQDVSALEEVDTYALAWVPAPFVPETALRVGAARVARALVPGGWLMLGHGRFADNPVDNALTRFKTVAYGGTALDETQAQALLREAGLVEVMTTPTPPGTPGITVGRRRR
jgi:SAM-dependent methyltransferase